MRISFIGTPYWMAPEVIQNAIGLKPYDEKVDIWSLGITAIECSQCDPPLANLDPLTAMYIIPSTTSPMLSDVLEWSDNFKNFVNLCLAKEPKERPSVNELLNHNLFQKINSNAFEEIAGCVDTWDDWSWDENKSFEKAIESSSSSHEEEDIKLDHPKQPRRSSSFQVDDKKIKKIKRKSQKIIIMID